MSIKTFAVSAIALATIAFASSSRAAEAAGDADATVIVPIQIAAANELSFGKFTAGTGGTVVVTTAGARSRTGDLVLSGIAVGGAGTFNVTGSPDATYSISVPESVTLTEAGSSTTMTVATFSDLTGSTATSTAAGNVTAGALSAGGTQTIYVGGELTVDAGEVAGTYTGGYNVTVEYN